MEVVEAPKAIHALKELVVQGPDFAGLLSTIVEVVAKGSLEGAIRLLGNINFAFHCDTYGICNENYRNAPNQLYVLTKVRNVDYVRGKCAFSGGSTCSPMVRLEER
jgi:hypothetical protein